MAPQTPVLLVDNLFDTVNLYPAASLADSSELTGREAFRVADYRRERSWWQPTSDGGGTANFLAVDLGAGNTADTDFLWIDRGHNLWTRGVHLYNGPAFGSWTVRQFRTVPAAGTVGGDPTTGFCVTEEGALYTFFPGPGATRAWKVEFDYVASFVPVVPGLMLGKRSQFLGFSGVKDEDAMMRSEISEQSQALYRGTAKRYTARTLLIDLKYIGATEYDGMMRTLRRQLFELDQPALAVMDYGTKPERGWLYQWDGTTYSAPTTRVTRGIQYRMREVGPLLR